MLQHVVCIFTAELNVTAGGMYAYHRT